MPTRRPIEWLTDLSLLQHSKHVRANHNVVTLVGKAWRGRRALSLVHKSRSARIVLLHQPPSWIIAILIVLRTLSPWHRYKVAILDMVFTGPGRVVLSPLLRHIKRHLYSRVDLFISYMKHIKPLEELYGIAPRNHAFVHFKPNAFARQHFTDDFPAGDYVFAGGQSRRDFSTFCRAMASLPYPGVLATPRDHIRRLHETSFDETHIPDNVKIVHDDGSTRSWLQLLSNAKVVVVPIGNNSISPSGVGVYLQAMALGKCVIVSECPATKDILESGSQALLVPQCDAEALTEAIRIAWEHDDIREAVAARGRCYARSLGGEQELTDRVADAVISRLKL